MKNYILNIYSNYLLEEEMNKIIAKDDNIINLNYDDLKIDNIILSNIPNNLDNAHITP